MPCLTPWFALRAGFYRYAEHKEKITPIQIRIQRSRATVKGLLQLLGHRTDYREQFLDEKLPVFVTPPRLPSVRRDGSVSGSPRGTRIQPWCIYPVAQPEKHVILSDTAVTSGVVS